MTHFTVTVCVPDDDELETKGIEERVAEILAPYDEKRDDIEPWKHFEDCSPSEFWWPRSIMRVAKYHHDGTVSEREVRRVAEANMPITQRYGRTRREPNETELRDAEVQVRAENTENAKWAERLGDNPTWETVVDLYNEKYHPDNALAIPGSVAPGEIDTERMHYDEETGRAYTWSRSNPKGYWDWYVIGGRWQGRLIATLDANPRLLVFGSGSESDGDDGAPRMTKDGALRCDGGPRTMLDFDAMRDRDATAAAERYDNYLALVENYGTAKGWSHFRALVEATEITWDEARRQYRQQDLIVAHDAIPYENQIVGLVGCIVDEFLTDRDTYIQNARDAAVPGYAMIDLDGRWQAPGKMGWFGVSSEPDGERDAYQTLASRYLDELPANSWVVQVDCHG